MGKCKEQFMEVFKDKKGLEYINSDIDLEDLSIRMERCFQPAMRMSTRESVDSIVKNIIKDINKQFKNNSICYKFSFILNVLLKGLEQGMQYPPHLNAYYLLRFIINYMEINKLELGNFDEIKDDFYTLNGPLFNKDFSYKNTDTACILHFLNKLYYDTCVKKSFLFPTYDKQDYSIESLIFENQLLSVVIVEQQGFI